MSTWILTFCFSTQQKIKVLCYWIRDARFFLVHNTKTVKIYTKLPKCPVNIQYGCKIFQMDKMYNNIFHSKVLHNIPKLVVLVWKETIWQPWSELIKFVSFKYQSHATCTTTINTIKIVSICLPEGNT
jgi:hypothetical protein